VLSPVASDGDDDGGRYEDYCSLNYPHAPTVAALLPEMYISLEDVALEAWTRVGGNAAAADAGLRVAPKLATGYATPAPPPDAATCRAFFYDGAPFFEDREAVEAGVTDDDTPPEAADYLTDTWVHLSYVIESESDDAAATFVKTAREKARVALYVARSRAEAAEAVALLCTLHPDQASALADAWLDASAAAGDANPATDADRLVALLGYVTGSRSARAAQLKALQPTFTPLLTSPDKAAACAVHPVLRAGRLCVGGALLVLRMSSPRGDPTRQARLERLAQWL